MFHDSNTYCVTWCTFPHCIGQQALNPGRLILFLLAGSYFWSGPLFAPRCANISCRISTRHRQMGRAVFPAECANRKKIAAEHTSDKERKQWSGKRVMRSVELYFRKLEKWHAVRSVSAKLSSAFVPNTVTDNIQAVSGERMTLQRSIIAPFIFKPYFRDFFFFKN